MAKKKKKTEEEANQDLWDKTPVLHDVINKNNWDFITLISENTKNKLIDEWLANFEENYKTGLWDKHQALVADCVGLGKNKAVIGVGAGPSFNLNKDVLRYYTNLDGVRDWEYRSFITICSNHQFKPLLEFGIIPDFVLLVDGSDVVYDQLCKDIPKTGQNTILITGVHCSPKVLKAWSEQGREIRFFLNTAEKVQNHFKKITGLHPKKYLMEMGGNCLNGAWTISCQLLKSYVFMAVGNDLAFKIDENVEKQKEGYYSDGDYSTNAWGTGTGRDEAKSLKRWAGFTLEKSPLIFLQSQKGLDRYNIKLDVIGTAHNLWVYKNWLEATVLRMSAVPKNSLHYFNCSEAGILGVMARKDDDDALKDKDNWFMLDEKCRCYHTALLKDALIHFEKCKEVFECRLPLDVPNVGSLVQ